MYLKNPYISTAGETMHISLTIARSVLKTILFLFSFFLTGLSAYGIGWPVWPDSLIHLIGNSYGEYQCYPEPTGFPYLHPGVDLMVPPYTPVYAVKSGYVKAVVTTSEELHWRVVIGDSAGTQECDAWVYAHLRQSTIPVSVGDYVEEGEVIGDIVAWHDADFHHLHFVQVRHHGDSAAWSQWQNWQYVTNALDVIESQYDPDPPAFEPAYESQSFAFAINYTSVYFPAGAPLIGDVDIVCRVYDYINDYNWKLAPHKIEYRIEGDSSIPWTNSVCFTGILYSNDNVYVVYQNDATCDTWANYDERIYYFNVTNTDGDSVIEASDALNCWQTSYFPNGTYTVYVRAHDAFGNSTIESMDIAIENYSDLSGTITLEGQSNHGQTIVTVLLSGQSDTTNYSGQFSIPDISGGSQPIEIRHPGYEVVDTVVMMHQNQTLDLTLAYLYTCGDVNGDEIVNILDVTFLISYLYKDGPTPDIVEACDANGDGIVNILDITYLISYLYKGGAKPKCL